MIKKKIEMFFLKVGAGLMFLIFASACGHSTIESSGGTPSPSPSASSEFSLASDFPSDLVIPDIDGMRSTAFTVSTSSPAGVIPIDLDSNPFSLSKKFSPIVCPPGSGIPSKLIVRSSSEAFLLTSNSIISFNPETGSIYGVTSVIESIDIGSGHQNSDGTPSNPQITPSFPGGIALNGDTLFVSSANYLQTYAPAKAAPGTISVFQIGAHGSVTRTGHVITSGFNPTGISVRSEDEIVVTNSGVIEIADAKAVPVTRSSVDLINTDALEINANIPLGYFGASFHRPALTEDKSRAFIGSAAYGRVYEIDLINKQVLRGISNPIAVSSSSDYISDIVLGFDNSLLFASSFEQSSVIQIDLTKENPVETNQYVVGFPAGVTSENPSGANTGAGPLAVRPGIKGNDFSGPDLFVVTGYPGKLVSITTANTPQISVDAPEPEPEEEDPPTDAPPAPADENIPEDTPCQGFAQAVKSVHYGTGAGFGQNKFPQVVMGAPKGMGATSGSLDVLSLGIGGEIILDMGSCWIKDGTGIDFIVFENPFFIGGNEAAPYAELASVAVSNDGISFVKFPCRSDSLPYDGCAGWHPVYSAPVNGISPFDPSIAGGDAFDLAAVGVNSARYIRLRDVRGTQGGASSGFDLDAIAVVNGIKK